MLVFEVGYYYFEAAVVAAVVEVSPLVVAAAVELLQSYGVADVAAAVSLPQPSLTVVARTSPSAA